VNGFEVLLYVYEVLLYVSEGHVEKEGREWKEGMCSRSLSVTSFHINSSSQN